MKVYSLILSLLIGALSSAGAAPVQGPVVQGGIVVNDSLQKLMSIAGVQTIYTGCQKSYESTPPADKNDKILTCLWDTVQKDAALKQKVLAAYTDELKGAGKGRAPASGKVNLTARQASVSTDYQSDPAVAALSEFYGKKLDAILDPEKALTKDEQKKNLILSTDHRQFVDLYKSELGKTIISAFTSYCLDTDPNKCDCIASGDPNAPWNCSGATCEIDADESVVKKNREANLASLKGASLELGSKDEAKWKACIGAVTNACTPTTPNTKPTETARRACLVMDYVASARKNIIATDEQKKFYDDLNKTQTIGIAGNTKAITDLKKISTDAVLEITSSDVKKALDRPITDSKAEMDKCTDGAVILDIDACKQYLNTNRAENMAAIAELGMRQIAQEGILQEELDSDPTRVNDYLKEEGFSDEEIKNMTAKKTDIDTIKNKILERYRSQKAAIIKEMAARIEDKTSSEEGKIDAKADLQKIVKIRNELYSRSDDLQNLVYFNNVVSSYLETNDAATKTSSRNTASLFAEANSNEDEKTAEGMKEQIKNAKLKDQKGNANTTDLNVDTINGTFLNYK